MSFQDFTQALEIRLDAINPKPPIAWPNQNYSPVTGTLYLQPSELPGTSSTATIDYSELQIGIYQIDVRAPIDTGAAEALSQAEAIADHFAAQRKLTRNGTEVRIKSISRNQGLRDGAWFVVSVSIVYDGYIKRN